MDHFLYGVLEQTNVAQLENLSTGIYGKNLSSYSSRTAHSFGSLLSAACTRSEGVYTVKKNFAQKNLQLGDCQVVSHN